jgi:hypothetical protein
VLPYTSAIPISQYPLFGGLSIAFGIILTFIYFIYLMKKNNNSIIIELLLGFSASIGLGLGTIFIVISFGLYL